MKVILAQPRGFCAGVVRAIEIVERALAKFGAPISVRHEIVHNRYVIESLKAKGARLVKNLSELPRRSRTIFCAHGVARQVEEEVAEFGLPVIDAPCPLVAKVHGQGEHYVAGGRAVALIGHTGHREVEGTMRRIPDPVYLVQSEADVAKLALAAGTPLAYVTQTTFSVDDTKSVIATLRQKFSDIVARETKDICYATQNRPSAGCQLSKFVDVILVAGAKNSSSSDRLREIGAKAKVPGYLIADRNDLSLFRGAETIGLTAGASAPAVAVYEVTEALRPLRPIEFTTLPSVEEDIEFRLPSNFLDAQSARRFSVAAS